MEAALCKPVKNFWSEGVYSSTLPSLNQSISCDFLIIGGGLSGLSAALHIKKLKPESKVILVESEKIGNSSSGLNSGQCSTRIGPAIEKQVKNFSRELVSEIYQYSHNAMQYAAALISENHIQCDLKSSEQLQVALTEKDARLLRHRAQIYQMLGFNIQLIEKTGIKNLFPESDTILNALKFDAYMLNPYKLCVGLKEKVLQLGVHIYENTKVSFKKRQQLIAFCSKGYRIQFRRSILAVNSEIDKFSTHVGSVLPIAVFAAVTRPLSHLELSSIGWKEESGLFDTRPAFNFLRLINKNRILIGGEYRYAHSGQIELLEQNRCLNSLQSQLGLFFPSLKDLCIEYKWHGLVGCTLDEWPVIGPINNNNSCLYIGAWNGHGVAASLAGGREVAQVVTDDYSPHFPWYRSSVRGLGHPVLARMTLPHYLAFLRKRSQF